MTAYRFYYLDHAERARYGKAAMWCLPMCVTAYMPEERAAKFVKELNHRDREKRTWRYELCPPGDIDHPESAAWEKYEANRSQSTEREPTSIAQKDEAPHFGRRKGRRGEYGTRKSSKPQGVRRSSGYERPISRPCNFCRPEPL